VVPAPPSGATAAGTSNALETPAATGDDASLGDFGSTAPPAPSEPAAVAASDRETAQPVPPPASPGPVEAGIADELLLEINARDAVWLSITADGEQAWQGILQPNQSREVQARETIQLKVGNAGGVDLTLNGREMGVLGRDGEVKTVTLAAHTRPDSSPQQ
jgi:cytoskeleton protein RodZ